MTMEQIGSIAAKLVDRWAWYQAALKDPAQIGNTLKIYDGEPQQGYYRVRPKDGQWEPVAIFYPEDSDSIVAYRNGKEVRADDIWLWCCRHPISFEAYEKAMAGGGFDDEPAPARGIGDNSGDADPLDAISIELAGEIEQVRDFMRQPVETQAQADRLGIWAKRLTDLAKKADNHRVVEKQPHLDASRAVDDRWREPIADAKDWAAKAKKHIEPFLLAKRREEEERQRRAREEAEAAQRAAVEAARKAQESDQQSAQEREAAQREADRLAAQAKQAERDAEERRVNAGRTGARVSIRIEKKGEIVDYDAFIMAVKDREEVRELMQSLANRAAKGGFVVPGLKIIEVEKAV